MFNGFIVSSLSDDSDYLLNQIIVWFFIYIIFRGVEIFMEILIKVKSFVDCNDKQRKPKT